MVLLSFLLLVVIAIVLSMPEPFSRVLKGGEHGQDVLILQQLLPRTPGVAAPPITSTYDTSTVQAVKAFQLHYQLSVDGIFGPASAAILLRNNTYDGYVDDHSFPLPAPYKYKVHIPVYANRSIETTGTLFNVNGTVLMKFTVRARGQSLPNGEQKNQFSTDGSTPTGLVELDLNSPEPDPVSYGPYPVNRAVKGLKGNAVFCMSNTQQTVRRGILLHTGLPPAWPSPPSAPIATSPQMPNSHGCMHAWAPAIHFIWQSLVADGVVVNKNPFGKIPYPYQPQGLLSVEQYPPQ